MSLLSSPAPRISRTRPFLAAAFCLTAALGALTAVAQPAHLAKGHQLVDEITATGTPVLMPPTTPPVRRSSRTC
jgi:hypothetical protein